MLHSWSVPARTPAAQLLLCSQSLEAALIPQLPGCWHCVRSHVRCSGGAILKELMVPAFPSRDLAEVAACELQSVPDWLIFLNLDPSSC